MDDCGISIVQGKALYGYKHGFGYGWLALDFQRVFVALWNFVACKVFGHRFLDYSQIPGIEDNDLVCTDCLKRWPQP